MAWAIAGRADPVPRSRIRFTLRSKLALLSLVLLALPWVGYRYVQEMEHFLLDAQRQSVQATARAVATALHERPELFGVAPRQYPSEVAPQASMQPGEQLLDLAPALPAPSRRSGAREVEAILKGLQRATSRIWVTDRSLRIIARAGSLAAPAADDPHAGLLQRGWRHVLGWLPLSPRHHAVVNADADGDADAPAFGPEIFSTFLGGTSVWVRDSGDGAGIVAAAAPVWVGDEVLGAVVVEESTHSILTLRNQAFERLALLTVVGFALTALLVLGFASRLSWRIRRLRDEAESAIDARGRIANLSTGSTASDEVGDLSRSFSALLARLTQHHSYLESMASRLSHELRTPIAVVRSSLENLHMEPLPASAQTYIERAEAGLTRLSRILARMSEATRMEQSLATTTPERFDLRNVVSECANGYRLAHDGREFIASLPRFPVWVRGAPDLAAQLLDKLVENAVDFATPGTPIVIELDFEGYIDARLSVTNEGAPIAPELQGRLFESMVSGRMGEGGDKPHLGLGLYVARMIARFHGGDLHAENLPAGVGVRFRAMFRLA